jgi:hypothetical protein
MVPPNPARDVEMGISDFLRGELIEVIEYIGG